MLKLFRKPSTQDLSLLVETEVKHRTQAARAIGASTVSQLRGLSSQGLTLTPDEMIVRVESVLGALGSEVPTR